MIAKISVVFPGLSRQPLVNNFFRQYFVYFCICCLFFPFLFRWDIYWFRALGGIACDSSSSLIFYVKIQYFTNDFLRLSQNIISTDSQSQSSDPTLETNIFFISSYFLRNTFSFGLINDLLVFSSEKNFFAKRLKQMSYFLLETAENYGFRSEFLYIYKSPDFYYKIQLYFVFTLGFCNSRKRVILLFNF